MENSTNILTNFFRQLEAKVLDNSFEQTVLEELKQIKAELTSIKKEALDYQEKKYMDDFIAVYKVPELMSGAVSKRTVETWISKKLILPIQIGRKRYFRRDDFEAFMDQHKRK